MNIYNSKGQFLETLANNYFHQGDHIIYWQPKTYASGIYFVQISDAITTQNQKLYSKVENEINEIFNIVHWCSYADTTIVAFDAVHQSFGDLGTIER